MAANTYHPSIIKADTLFSHWVFWWAVIYCIVFSLRISIPPFFPISISTVIQIFNPTFAILFALSYQLFAFIQILIRVRPVNILPQVLAKFFVITFLFKLLPLYFVLSVVSFQITLLSHRNSPRDPALCIYNRSPTLFSTTDASPIHLPPSSQTEIPENVPCDDNVNENYLLPLNKIQETLKENMLSGIPAFVALFMVYFTYINQKNLDLFEIYEDLTESYVKDDNRLLIYKIMVGCRK